MKIINILNVFLKEFLIFYVVARKSDLLFNVSSYSEIEKSM